MAGQITTCYSFKGGSGRSMSLANMAWVLATRGARVLVVDWDLEAPGVHRYFHPFLQDPLQQESRGLIDGLWAYVNAVPDGAVRRQQEFAAMDHYVQKLTLPLSSGTIDLLGAGSQDESYTTKVGNFDWSTFYGRMGGKSFVDHFGRWARGKYDHILIDSRTGVSDTAGICTMQLPDVLALFFVYNRQSIEGAAAAGRAVRSARPDNIRIIPCPSRVEDKRIATPARQYAALCLEDVLGERPTALARTLRIHETMHFPWCAYEEKLAIFEEEPDESGTLLQATEAMSVRIAGRLEGVAESVDRDRLNAYWRRAAFRDPRIDQLEVLRSGSLSQRVPQLTMWLAETLEENTTAPTWVVALALECVSLAGSASGVLANSDSERLGVGSVELARRARGAQGTDDMAIAEILRSRASQLVKGSRLAEAQEVVAEAIALAQASEGVGAWGVLGRSLEVQAEIQRLTGDLQAALETADELITLQSRRSAIKSNPANQDTRARISRLRASLLLDLGRFADAEQEARRAFGIARTGSEQSPEPALARLLSVRAALAGGALNPERTTRSMRTWLSEQDLPDITRRELEVRLTLVEAEHYREHGDLNRARALLDGIGAGVPTWAAAEVAELTARIEVIGATDALPGFPDQPFSLNNLDQGQIVDLLRQALANAGDEATRNQVVLDFLTRNGMGEIDRSAEGDGGIADALGKVLLPPPAVEGE